MKDELMFIMTKFNIKKEDLGRYLLEDIKEEIEKIKDFNDFRLWLKDNFNNLETKYLRGVDKFLFLSSQYVSAQTPALALSELEKKAHDLASKLIDCFPFHARDVLRDEKYKFEYSIFSEGEREGERVFSIKETNILDRINTNEYYDMVQDRFKLESRLLQVYKSETKKLLAPKKKINNILAQKRKE